MRLCQLGSFALEGPFRFGPSTHFRIVPGMMIVFNPVAGRRRAQRCCGAYWTCWWRTACDSTLAKTNRCPGDAACPGARGGGAGETMVVAAGGDGTIAEVANGLLGTGVRVGRDPVGHRQCAGARTWLPFAPRAVAAALAFGRTRRLWPGMARGADGSRLFVQMLGIGFDAHVVHRLPVPLKRAFGRGAYVLQTMRDAVSYAYPQITVRLDDQETQAASVIVSKGRLYAGRYLLAADAVPGDPGFSVVAVPPRRRRLPR